MKKLLKVQYIFYLFLLAAFGVILYTILTFRVDNRTIRNSDVARLDDWKITFSDGSSRNITLPNEVNVKKEDTVVLSHILNADFYGTTVAFRTENQNVVVTLDGKKIYEFGAEVHRSFGKSAGSLWHYVQIPSEFENGKLEIALTSPFSNLGGSVGEVLYGAKSSCILYFMQEEWICLFAGFALLLFGALFMMYHFAMGHLKLRNTGMFHLGVSCVLTAAHIIILTGLPQIFYGNSSVYYFSAYTLLYIFVVPFLLYLADTILEDCKRLLHGMAAVFLVDFVVAAGLHMDNKLDYYYYEPVFKVLVILGILFLIAVTIRLLYKKGKEQNLLLFMILLLVQGIAMILDIVRKSYQSIAYGEYSFLIMLLLLGSVNIFKVVRDYRVDLEAKMLENDTRSRILESKYASLEQQVAYLQESKEYADSYSASKSIFLSSVSKKLIVPIGTIAGMADLALRDEINDNVREKLVSVQTAATTALTLTNNIIDYTQYETNSLELKCVAYPVAKMLYDMSESVSVGLVEKNVDFIVDFSPDLPKELYGDEIRIRQILSTILSNAVRYTEEGSIRFRVDAEINQADEIFLNITVSDTGAGISKENLDGLFDMFLLYKTEDAVAGTGLGLAVCKKLIDLMDGEITVESELGKGTTFQLKIPQKIINGMPLVEVARIEFKTLVYETNLLQKMMLKKVFMDLSLDVEFASNDEEFIAKLDSGVYHTVLICESQYEKHMEYLQEPLNASIRKVVIADIANSIQTYENADILQRPIHCMNLYDAISGNEIVEPIAAENTINQFIAPQAKVLIVDDNPANLKIATGMMEQYKVHIQTAMGGNACLEMLQEEMDYDLVFLDYAMTGMSGVETLRTLREYSDKYYKTLPVIAMTVHMVNGAKELFVEEGFDDYIAKPLEEGRLCAILEKFLPEEKIIRNEASEDMSDIESEEETMQEETFFEESSEEIL